MGPIRRGNHPFRALSHAKDTNKTNVMCGQRAPCLRHCVAFAGVAAAGQVQVRCCMFSERRTISNMRKTAIAVLVVMFQIFVPALALGHSNVAGDVGCTVSSDVSAVSDSSASRDHQPRHSSAGSHAECCLACGGALQFLESVVSSFFLVPHVSLDRPEPADAGPIFAEQFLDSIVGPRGPPARGVSRRLTRGRLEFRARTTRRAETIADGMNR